jgi:hypothetical protein
MSEDQYDPQMRYTEHDMKVSNIAFKDMDFSNPFKELPKALSAVKKEMNTTVAKDATNPHFRKKYSTLDASLDAASKILGSHGLAVVQMPTDDILYTMMTHSSGEYIRFAYKMEIKEKTAQGRGSALTYARRYCYQAMVGLAPGDDDDGEKAMERNEEKKEEKPKSTRSKASSKSSEQEKEKKEKEKQVNKEFKGAMKEAFEFDHNTKTEEVVETILETFPGSEVVESSPAADPPADTPPPEYKPAGVAKIYGLQIPRQKTIESLSGLKTKINKEESKMTIPDTNYLYGLIAEREKELNA